MEADILSTWSYRGFKYKKMIKKILFIGWFFYPKVGGVESLMLNQALWLSKKGYDVTVLTSRLKDQKKTEQLENIRIIREDYINPNDQYPIDRLKDNFLALLKNINPTIIHFHNSSYPFLASPAKTVAMFEVGKSFGCKIIEQAHNAQINKPNMTGKIRRLPWDQLICVSNFVKKNWQHLGTAAKNLPVVYNGINLEGFKGVRPDEKILKLKKEKQFSKIIFFAARITRISTGRIDQQKNFILLLKACKKLLRDGFNDFIVLAFQNESLVSGKAEESFQKIKDLIIKYGLKDHIVFQANISPEKIKSYYQAIDVVCVPSIRETFGLVYIEAMASGKVAIASSTGGPVEYIKNGKNGYLVDPKNPNDLAEVLHRVLMDEKLREKISREGLITAKKFSLEIMMKKIEEVYKKILETK